MQQSTGVAVPATHLAGTDRRALSQAWYSALHLADRTAPARPAPAAPAGPGCAAERPRGARGSGSFAAGATERGTCVPLRSTSPCRDADGCDAERRAPKSEVARRIEHGRARRTPRGVPASFAVHGAGGRVQLIVRSDGARTRILAVCAPALRERVERALAHARFALAGHGVRAEVA